MIRIKRIYDEPSTKDSVCFLVDRLWPRGIKKQALPLDGGWLKEAAPSDALRRWYGHDQTRWPAFEQRYRVELDEHPQDWQPILDAARRHDVTLYYASRDTEHNNALVLQRYLQKKLKR